MGNLPSINTIESALKVTRETARAVRRCMELANNNEDVREITGRGEAFKIASRAAEDRHRECYSHPCNEDVAIHAIDALIETCGVESFVGDNTLKNDRSRKFNGNHIYYCNAGDTYAATVAWDATEDRWYVAHWGWFVGD